MPTLAEQVAALEAERDAWRERADIARAECAAAESRLASARVEGTRTETKVEWRNVYRDESDGREFTLEHWPTREIAERNQQFAFELTRIAIERIETTTTITREEL